MGARLTARHTLAVVPFSQEFAGGRLFLTGTPPDRDGSLKPYAALAKRLRSTGWTVDTVDRLDAGTASAWLHLDSAGLPPTDSDPDRTVLMMFEPEVVSPFWYRRAREARLQYRRVYTYSRELVAHGEPYRYLHCPQALGAAPVALRDEFLVMVNARKYPARREAELYSTRERVAAWFARRGLMSIYGRGWDRISLRHPISALRTTALRAAARGVVDSKFGVLGRAKFVLCFENMVSPGYHTEKLFDAIAGGAVPVYLGDPEITDTVPAGAFIDYRDAGSPEALHRLLMSTDDAAQERIRVRGRQYLASTDFTPYSIDAFVERLKHDFEELS